MLAPCMYQYGRELHLAKRKLTNLKSLGTLDRVRYAK